MNVVVNVPCGGSRIFPGDFLFSLKDTHGFPLDFALDRILVVEQMQIDWESFIEAARRAGWWDFQTYEVLSHAMQDVPLDRTRAAEIRKSFEVYVVQNPHPRML